MVGVDGDGDAGSRRRLPSWMLGLAQQPQNESQNQKTKKTSCTTISTLATHSHSGNVVSNKNRGSRHGRKRKDKSVDCNENDIEAELTVQDLLSIAKEYVEADAVTDEQLRTTKRVEKDPKAAPNSVRISPTRPATASCNSTGDPAQDMLDLFLGPLLKKPLEQEKKTEFDANDMDFFNKFRKLSQTEAREEIASPMKIKSSLKDKVAMLLD